MQSRRNLSPQFHYVNQWRIVAGHHVVVWTYWSMCTQLEKLQEIVHSYYVLESMKYSWIILGQVIDNVIVILFRNNGYNRTDNFLDGYRRPSKRLGRKRSVYDWFSSEKEKSLSRRTAMLSSNGMSCNYLFCFFLLCNANKIFSEMMLSSNDLLKVQEMSHAECLSIERQRSNDQCFISIISFISKKKTSNYNNLWSLTDWMTMVIDRGSFRINHS